MRRPITPTGPNRPQATIPYPITGNLFTELPVPSGRSNQYPVLRLIVDGRTRRSFGTGWIAGVAQTDRSEIRAYVITNHHVARSQGRSPKSLSAEWPSDPPTPRLTWPFTILAEDPTDDIALLELTTTPYVLPTATLGPTWPQGVTVQSMGFPEGSQTVYTRTSRSLLSGGITRLPKPGESGGPVFSQGQVVGMMQLGVFNDGAEHGRAIPVSTIRAFLTDCKIQFPYLQGVLP